MCPFTKKRFETFLCRREERLQFEEVALGNSEKFAAVCPQDESSENGEQYFFHRKCYNSFTDISKIKRARQQQNVLNYDAEKEKSRKEVEPQSPNQNDGVECHDNQGRRKRGGGHFFSWGGGG